MTGYSQQFPRVFCSFVFMNRNKYPSVFCARCRHSQSHWLASKREVALTRSILIAASRNFFCFWQHPRQIIQEYDCSPPATGAVFGVNFYLRKQSFGGLPPSIDMLAWMLEESKCSLVTHTHKITAESWCYHQPNEEAMHGTWKPRYHFTKWDLSKLESFISWFSWFGW